MAMAQPSTETPALRLSRGAPRPIGAATAVAGAALRASVSSGRKAGDAKRRQAAEAGAKREAAAWGSMRAARTIWKADISGSAGGRGCCGKGRVRDGALS
eukprot:CAMPEP_0180583492 /NCGR_PEP_ID=MMETSP1037_2-20121125/15101_1 /TAXON_ID=632150 /ORGANISM="Azadinium spinosum, Strain 3D9" /LENGTH=99 /DNA_ID=CAMNT_0022601519 /DNA_START=8 /DNA_END=304 /DNA_ORIENTATION=-